ncbi:MAG: regulatory protein RecX [Thermodesulfovibrionales bacterium]
MSHKNKDTVDYQKALDYSLRLLTLRDRSESDIRDRLFKKGYNDKTVDMVIERLNLLGYLNEDRLLGRLLKVALEEKNYGRYGIKQFLISKGIRKELISNLSIPEDEYIRSAICFVNKKRKLLKSKDDTENKKRLSQMLIRRGHDNDTIKKVLGVEGILYG